MIKKLFLLTCLVLPTFSSASFTDMYATWVEHLLGNPTARLEKIASYSQYGQESTIHGSLLSDEFDGSATLNTTFTTDKGGNIQGTVQLDAEGNNATESGSIQASAAIVFASGTLYVKPTLTQLPHQITEKEKVGFQLLDGKWIKMNDPLDTVIFGSAINSGVSINHLEMTKKILEQVKATPILTSKKSFTRNGYEIHLVDLDMQGIENLVAGVLNTVTTSVGISAEESLSLNQNIGMTDTGIKTYGVIGQKGDEIKMGMLVTAKNDPMRFIITSTTTPTHSKIYGRALYNASRIPFAQATPSSPLGQFRIDITTPTPDTQTTTLSVVSAEDSVDGEVTISTRTYDAGSTPITAPTGAIVLADLMQ